MYYPISVLFSGIDVKNSNFGGRARWVNMITPTCMSLMIVITHMHRELRYLVDSK